MTKRKPGKKGNQRLNENTTPSLQSVASKPTVKAAVATTTASPLLLPLPFPSHLPRPDNNDFLLNQPPYRKSYQTALTTSYEGFVVDDQVDMEEVTVQRCLEDMKDYFRRDVTQPFGLGTKCAKTYVTRCLVGDPGTTYKYLGLRMFAHPWKSPTGSVIHNPSSKTTLSSALTQAVATTKSIFQLGQLLSERTKHHLDHLNQKRQRRGAPLTQGRSIFDICLINRMDPTEKLKKEPSSVLSNLQTSVSWHADSSLENYSTIAVYQTLVDPSQQQQHQRQGNVNNRSNNQDQWYVAMRVTPHCEGPTVGTLKQKTNIQSTVDQTIPPIAASLPSGSAYYLLDDFNHHHQHTVLLSKGPNDNNGPTPSWIRYSCTFRLLRDSHNVEYILRRCQSVVSHFHKKGMKVWRSEQLLLTEVESEWIRQFYIQGSQHYDLLWEAYWKEPMEALLKYWSQLEHRTQQTCELLKLAAQAKCFSTSPATSSSSSSPPSKAERKARDKQKKALVALESLLERSTTEIDDTNFFEAMADLLEERAKMRELWAKREKDHVFSELAVELRPMPLPFQFWDSAPGIQDSGINSPLPGNPSTLRDWAISLRRFGKAFNSGRSQDLPMTKCFTKWTNDGDEAGNDDQHSKLLTWKGWSEPHLIVGLELQDPWASAILNGTKQIETRAYDLPVSLIGRRIWILESPSGKDGVSALGNDIDMSHPGTCQVVGWCTFTSVIRYTSKVAFDADEGRHLVSQSSGYGWKVGITKFIYGWEVGEYARVKNNDVSFIRAIRRMRSLFELTAKAPAKIHASKKTSQSQRPKKKRRY